MAYWSGYCPKTRLLVICTYHRIHGLYWLYIISNMISAGWLWIIIWILSTFWGIPARKTEIKTCLNPETVPRNNYMLIFEAVIQLYLGLSPRSANSPHRYSQSHPIIVKETNDRHFLISRTLRVDSFATCAYSSRICLLEFLFLSLKTIKNSSGQMR